MVGERVGLSLATSEDVGATEGADDGEGVDKVSAIDTVAGLLCSLMLFTNLGIKIPIPAADARMAINKPTSTFFEGTYVGKYLPANSLSPFSPANSSLTLSSADDDTLSSADDDTLSSADDDPSSKVESSVSYMLKVIYFLLLSRFFFVSISEVRKCEARIFRFKNWLF